MNTNRSVLIVTPFFAPQSHAAVFRAYKLAKYLPRFGWIPHVLTVDTNYLHPEDSRLLDELPPQVIIHRARYLEPSLRGLRMALGGRDRTFAALKLAGGSTAGSHEEARQPTWKDCLRDYVLRRWVQSPDAHWTWYGPAVASAREIIRQHEIAIVMTSADPFTSHRIGYSLKKAGCTWVADLRDPHGYCHRMHSSYDAVFLRQRRLERQAVEHADAVTVAANAIGMILADQYGPVVASRTHFIPTGLDEALIPIDDCSRPRNFPYLVYGGEYLPTYGSGFLEAFRDALQHPEIRARGIKLIVIGRLDVNSAVLGNRVKNLGLEEHVEFVDQIPQRELYRYLRHAEASVLLSAPDYQWWCLYAKLVDALAMRVPVVALVPDPSEARFHLNRAGLGIFLDGGPEERAGVLADFLSGVGSKPDPIEAECDRFLATAQVRAFADVFERVLGESPAENGELYSRESTYEKVNR